MGNVVLESVVRALTMARTGSYGPVARTANAKSHRHIAAAQRLALRAFEKIDEAPGASGRDLDGHVQRAHELLRLAIAELMQATAHERRAL